MSWKKERHQSEFAVKRKLQAKSNHSLPHILLLKLLHGVYFCLYRTATHFITVMSHIFLFFRLEMTLPMHQISDFAITMIE